MRKINRNIVAVLLTGLLSFGKCQFPMGNPYQAPGMFPVMMPSFQPNCITYYYPSIPTYPVFPAQMPGCGSPSQPLITSSQNCQPYTSVTPTPVTPSPPVEPPSAPSAPVEPHAVEPPPVEPPPVEPPPVEPPPVEPPPVEPPPVEPPPVEPPPVEPPPVEPPPVEPPPVEPPPVEPPPVEPPPVEPPSVEPQPVEPPPIEPPPVESPPVEPPPESPSPPAEPPMEPITPTPPETDTPVEAPVPPESPPGSSPVESIVESTTAEPDAKPIGAGCNSLYPIPSLTECQLLSSEPEKCASNNKCAYCLDESSKSKCDTYENTRINCLDMYFLYGPYITISDTEVEPTSIPLIPSMKKNFTLTVELSEIPLDFYYLMDFSGSFHDDKTNLVKKSPALIEELRNLNSDLAVGFGSFKDKPIPPFGGITDYSFWNKLSLTKDPSTFTDTINSTVVSGGADGPEGILDGLFQVSACEEQIGWRTNSRRFLLVTTDAPPHVAGEGLSKGLIPFDGKCHLNNEGRYTEDAVLDYPSIEQLKEIDEQNKTTLIFAVTANTLEIYKNISEQITGSAVIALDNDSGNIIEVVKKAYADATQFVEIQTTGLTDNMEVTYYSACNGDEEIETNICEAPADGVLTLIVELEMKTCPLPSGSTIPLTINPIGVTNSASINITPV